MCIVPRRITRNFRSKQGADDDEEEEDDEDDEVNAQQEEEQSDVPSPINDDSKPEEKNIASVVTETNDSRPRTRRAVAEASDKSNDHLNEECVEDLYTRIKRKRGNNQTKPNRKSILYQSLSKGIIEIVFNYYCLTSQLQQNKAVMTQ